MARDTKLSDDLAALAERERYRLGEPPSIEQLVELRDGELAEEEADRIRDRLAVDPEMAAIYLELKQRSDLETLSADLVGDDISDSEVGGAWHRLSSRLGQGTPLAVDPPNKAGEVVPFPRRGWGRVLALAATLTVVVGLVWLLAGRGGPAPLREGDYHVVQVTGEAYRDSRLRVPGGVAGLAFHIDASDLPSGHVMVELLDASDKVVRQEQMTVEAGQQEMIFRVASSSLVDGKTYQLVVRAPGAPPGDPVLIFEPVFDANPPGDGSDGLSSPDQRDAMASVACADLDPDLSRAIGLRKSGERRAADTAYVETLAAARARGCSFQEARASNGLGVVATQEWQLYKSLSHFDEAATALSALEGTAASKEDANALKRTLEFNRGVSYFRLGWLDDAHDAFQRVRILDRRDGAGPRRQANLLLQFVRISHLRGEPREAKETVREALALLGGEAPKLRASLWHEHARLDFEAGRFEAAEQAFDSAIEALEEVEDRLAKANVFADVGELEVRRGRWAESLQWVDRALDLASAGDGSDSNRESNLEIHVRHVQSMALQGLGDPEGAKRAADSGLALLESFREIWRDQQFFSLRQEHYRHRLDLAGGVKEPEDAWAVFEEFRARGLLESTGNRARRTADGAEPPDAAEIEQKRRELLEAVRQLDRLDPTTGGEVRTRREIVFRAHRRALRELQAAQLRSAGLRLPPAVVDPGAAIAMLDAETLGLVFAGGRKKYHLLILDPRHGLEGMTLDTDRQQLEDLVTKLDGSLGPDGSEEARRRLEDHARDLSRALLGPVAERLGGFRRLAIVAEGRLEGLPFEVLRHPRTDRRLIESHEIAYLPSFSVLGALRAQAEECASPASDLLAVGDPIFGSRDRRWPAGAGDFRTEDERLAFHRLPATEGEVNGIAALYPKSRVILGPEANPVRFLTEAPLHRVIHVASHARSDRQVPERSKIALSCIDAENHVLETCDLYFEDVVTLDLCGRTIVLSACETAGGRQVAGEGILGLPRAFLRAGASTVVASLWRVADEPTSELMIEFHRHLRAGEGPAAALQKAKLKLIAAGRPPSAWAAFVLLGDWRIAGPA